MTLPTSIRTGLHSGGHIQGIALDRAGGYLYCSFTTELVKYTLDGTLVGSVGGLRGHLGCLAMGPDGKIYGSLEYKNDEIGRGILSHTGGEHVKDAFYAVRFDGEAITRPHMDACADGIMSALYLREVVEDYAWEQPLTGGGSLRHRYGCSGIDGMTFAPLPGDPDGKLHLCVAYGVYGDINRTDNDHQVILAYDMDEWDSLARPLSQENMHTSGPDAPAGKYFVFTGNTTYGVQNLEYDPAHGRMMMAVYRGKKSVYPNYPMFQANWSAAPQHRPLAGFTNGTAGDTVPLLCGGLYDAKSGVFGWDFPRGTEGMIALGDDTWYFSHPFSEDGKWGAEICLYRYTGTAPHGWEKIEG